MQARGRGRLRIIGGKWRSRRLDVADGDGLRPTPDRVRETVFNWLQAELAGSACLDLFAGSGALGFEAASRGADKVVMVERNREACKALTRNIDTLKADNIQLVVADALEWLERNQRVFDIVFLDPPYRAGLLERCCALLERGKNLAESATIYLEHAPGDEPVNIPANWKCLKSKSAGQVSYKLFSRVEEPCQ